MPSCEPATEIDTPTAAAAAADATDTIMMTELRVYIVIYVFIWNVDINNTRQENYINTNTSLEKSGSANAF